MQNWIFVDQGCNWQKVDTLENLNLLLRFWLKIRVEYRQHLLWEVAMAIHQVCQQHISCCMLLYVFVIKTSAARWQKVCFWNALTVWSCLCSHCSTERSKMLPRLEVLFTVTVYSWFKHYLVLWALITLGGRLKPYLNNENLSSNWMYDLFFFTYLQ